MQAKILVFSAVIAALAIAVFSYEKSGNSAYSFVQHVDHLDRPWDGSSPGIFSGLTGGNFSNQEWLQSLEDELEYETMRRSLRSQWERMVEKSRDLRGGFR